MLQIANTDPAQQLIVPFQRNANTVSLQFDADATETFSAAAKITIGRSYEEGAIKTYTVGAGITLSLANKRAVWVFNPTDWDGTNAVGDVYLLQPSANQRDFVLTLKSQAAL
jgi:hypothetical protein